MPDDGVKRKLSAILSADAAGYTRLMSKDEVETLQRIKTYRELIRVRVEEHRGRVVDSPGDNILAEFPSALDAMRCAVDIQRALKDRNADIPADRRMDFRIGIHLGDVMVDGDRIYGDGVNIAARMEELSEIGGICISDSVHMQVKGKLDVGYDDIGKQLVKNITEHIQAFAVIFPSSTEDASISKSRTTRKSIPAIAVAIVLIAGLVAVWHYVLRSKISSETEIVSEDASVPVPEKPFIAVLPFDNMSSDPEQEHFADAITDEIISALSKSSMLTVIARNSTFTYKGKAVKVQQVGQELGVKHVLEGSVQKAGNEVRIIAQLVDAATGGHLWSETYERELQDVFALQAEISQSIAAALRVEYTEAELARVRRIATNSLTAYDSFWRGYDHNMRRTRDDNIQAIEYLTRAIELDPDYADAYALLADSHLFDYYMGYASGPQVLTRAFDLSRKAVALDGSSIHAHTAQASFYLLKDENQLALARAEKAISLDPNNPFGYGWAGWALRNMGRREEAKERLVKATQLDPYNHLFINDLGVIYGTLGQMKEAIAAYKRAIALNPGPETIPYFNVILTYAVSWRAQQNADPQVMDEALVMAENIVPLDRLSGHFALSWIYFYRKQHDLAIAEAEKALSIQPNYIDGYALLAEIYGFMGKPEKAIKIAKNAMKLGPPSLSEGPAWYSYSMGNAYRLLKLPVEAIASYRKGLDRKPPHVLESRTRLGLAITYAELGRMEEAKVEAAEILKLVPNFSVDVYGEREPYADLSHAERDMAALRKAGLK